MDYDKQAIGAAIRDARKKKGLTQERLAEAIDVTPNYIRHIEHGRRQPAMDTLFSIFRTLNMHMDQFMYPRSSPEKETLINEISGNLICCSLEELKIRNCP